MPGQGKPLYSEALREMGRHTEIINNYKVETNQHVCTAFIFSGVHYCYSEESL